MWCALITSSCVWVCEGNSVCWCEKSQTSRTFFSFLPFAPSPVLLPRPSFSPIPDPNAEVEGRRSTDLKFVFRSRGDETQIEGAATNSQVSLKIRLRIALGGEWRARFISTRNRQFVPSHSPAHHGKIFWVLQRVSLLILRKNWSLRCLLWTDEIHETTHFSEYIIEWSQDRVRNRTRKRNKAIHFLQASPSLLTPPNWRLKFLVGWSFYTLGGVCDGWGDLAASHFCVKGTMYNVCLNLCWLDC